jgi:hypothetical protein
MSILSRLRPAAIRASIVALAAVAFASSASAYQCPGAPSVDFRGLQTSQPQVMQFMVGMWQGEGPDPSGMYRRSVYTFDPAGTYTHNEVVCVAGYCTPRVFRGLYAAYSVQNGVLSLAMLDPTSGCSVSHLRALDQNALVNVNAAPNAPPLRRVSSGPQG